MEGAGVVATPRLIAGMVDRVAEDPLSEMAVRSL